MMMMTAKTTRESKMWRTDGPTDRRTDTARCRVACPRLKTSFQRGKERGKTRHISKADGKFRNKLCGLVQNFVHCIVHGVMLWLCDDDNPKDQHPRWETYSIWNEKWKEKVGTMPWLPCRLALYPSRQRAHSGSHGTIQLIQKTAFKEKHGKGKEKKADVRNELLLFVVVDVRSWLQSMV